MLKPQLQPPVNIREVTGDPGMPEPTVFRVSAGVYAYDFKQEFSGWPVLTVSGTAGAIVRMTPAELNDKANATGRIPHQNFGPAFWQYTLGTNGTQETYRPKFFMYGFRYLLVEIISAAGGNTPTPVPPQPLPTGDAFVHPLQRRKEPAMSRWEDLLLRRQDEHAPSHVPACETCTGTAVNTCTPLVLTSEHEQSPAKQFQQFPERLPGGISIWCGRWYRPSRMVLYCQCFTAPIHLRIYSSTTWAQRR